VEMNSRQIEMV